MLFAVNKMLCRNVGNAVFMAAFLPVLSLMTVVAASCGEKPIEKNGVLKMSEDQKDVALPSPVKEFVEAVNAGDEAGFLSFFDAETGVINDWGRIFTGHGQIKKWSDKEFIGAKGTITPQRIETKGKEISLWAGWKSNYYSGDSKFVFIVDGSSVKEMRIESAK